jgi:hypothetical protein
MLTVSESISGFSDLTLLASGTSSELGKKGPFKKIVECNTENISDLEKNSRFFDKAELFINVMNPVSTKFAKQRNVPVAQIDSLFWMWDDISKEVAESEFYFIQKFDGVKEQLEKFSGRIKNPVLVGPIIMEKPKVKQKNQLIINFGGIESAMIKIGKNSNYPFTVAKILCECLEKQDSFDSVLFVGLGKIMSQLKKKYAKTGFRFSFLNHDDFLEELAASKMLLTSPGLTTSFEAFSFGIPSFFLPPQNYSQYWNLSKFKKHGLVFRDTNWSSVFPDLEILPNEPEEIGVGKVLKAISRFDNEASAQKKISELISEILVSEEDVRKKFRASQNNYFDSLGGNGTKEISRQIFNFLEGKK